MSKRFVSCFWGGKANGGMFSNSNTPFSIASAAHAVELRHTRKGVFLKRIVLAGRNEATKQARIVEAETWVKMQNPEEGDIFQVIDVNQSQRYGLIVCVGEMRGRYDN